MSSRATAQWTHECSKDTHARLVNLSFCLFVSVCVRLRRSVGLSVKVFSPIANKPVVLVRAVLSALGVLLVSLGRCLSLGRWLAVAAAVVVLVTDE